MVLFFSISVGGEYCYFICCVLLEWSGCGEVWLNYEWLVNIFQIIINVEIRFRIQICVFIYLVLF